MTARSMILRADEVRRLLAGEVAEVRRAVSDRRDWVQDALPKLSAIVAGDIGDSFAMKIPYDGDPLGGHVGTIWCPLGNVGEQRWCKEAWAIRAEASRFTPVEIAYRADGEEPVWRATSRPASAPYYPGETCAFCWRSAVHMPRWASRLTVEVTAVRCERATDGKPWEWVATLRRVEVVR